nr:ribonuclease H-like domain-containing protein [Tanacetum cinerariifolium]
MEQPNPTFAKIPILDTGKFKQWKFKIQQYLQNEHYALWEVIEFGDSYEAHKDVSDTGSASEGSAKKKGRTVAVTTEDMQKRKNDRNRSDLDTMSLDDLYNHLKVYEPEVQNKSESNSQNMAFISSAKNSSRKEEVNTASFSTASTQFPLLDINQIDEDDIKKMDIKWNMDLLSMRADRFWKKTGKKITIQGTDVAGFDKLKVECFNCHTMGYFARECRVPRSQDRGRRENFKYAPKALMAIDRVGWDWSYMANEEEDHALVDDQEAPTEFTLMAKSSSENKVFDNSLCSKACKKNTYSLNTKITDLSEKLSDSKTMLYHYKLGLSQVEARLIEFKNQEIKFCKKIRGLEFKVESKDNRIERLSKELEELKKEKEGLDSKLIVYSPPKRDMSWTGLPEFADDTITDYSRPSPSIENDSPTEIKTNKDETVRKSFVKYAKMYRKTLKSSNGNSQNVTDDKGYWDSGCSRHMTECIVLGRDFKLKDDTNVLLRTPRQHNMYYIDLNNIVPHKDLTCLVAKASTDESVLWHMRL